MSSPYVPMPARSGEVKPRNQTRVALAHQAISRCRAAAMTGAGVPTPSMGEMYNAAESIPATMGATGAVMTSPAIRLQGLIAGLVITAPVAPIVAGMLSAALYISPIEGVGTPAPVIAAALHLLIAWWASATLVWFLGFTSPDRAGMGTYGELIAQLQEIYAWAEWSESETSPPRHTMSRSAWGVARNELVGQVIAIQQERKSRGARWVLATGYMTLWRRLHRAQEALIEIAPSEAVIKYAQYDVLRISNATMARSDTYVCLLSDAIKLLSAGRNVDAILDRLIAEVQAVLAALGTGRPGPDVVPTLQDRSAVILSA